MQNRWKSKVFWVAVATNLITIGTLTGLWAEIGWDPNTVTQVIMLVINTAVTIFGLSNNPTNKNGY